MYVEQIRKFLLPRPGAREGFVKSPPTVTMLFGDSTFTGKFTKFSVRKNYFSSSLSLEFAEVSVEMIRWNPRFPRTFASFAKVRGGITLPFERRTQDLPKTVNPYINR
jgi:hypothetical protein